MDIDEPETYPDAPYTLRSYQTSGKGACDGSVPNLAATIHDPRVLSINGLILSQIHALAPHYVDWHDWKGLKRLVTTSLNFARHYGCSSYESFGRIMYLDMRAGNVYVNVSWTNWRAFLRWCMSEGDFVEFVDYYSHLLNHVAVGRRLFVTQNGFLGMGTWNIREGDDVCILSGGQVPYVLRPVDNYPDSWRYIGDAYVDGIMEVRSNLPQKLY